MNQEPNTSTLTELEQRLDFLLARIENDRREAKQIEQLMNQAKGVAIGWSEKVITAISQAREPMTMDEILRACFAFNPELISDAKMRRGYVQQLSFTLNRLSQVKNVLYGLKVQGVQGKVYCLGEWKGEDGEIRPEYRQIVDYKINRLMRNAKGSVTKRFFAA